MSDPRQGELFRPAGGERPIHREARDRMVGQLMRQGLDAEAAREAADRAAIRHEINDDTCGGA